MKQQRQKLTPHKREYPPHSVDVHDGTRITMRTRFYDPACIESIWAGIDDVIADAYKTLNAKHPIIEKLNRLQAHMRLAHEERS